MKWFGFLSRIALLLVCLYGSYLVSVEHRITIACQKETTNLEAQIAKEAGIQSTSIVLKKIRSDTDFCTWYYRVPANKSFRVVLYSAKTTSTLLTIPKSGTDQNGLLQVHFRQEKDVNALPRKMEVFGPEFLYGSHEAVDQTGFANIAFWNRPLPEKPLPFEKIVEQLKPSIRGRTVIFPQYPRQSKLEEATEECTHVQPLALCCFEEREQAGAIIHERTFLLKAVTSDE